MKRLLIYYNFIIVTGMSLAGFLNSQSVPELISAILFFPLAFYLWINVVPTRSRALVMPKRVPHYAKASRGKPNKSSQSKKKAEVAKIIKEGEELGIENTRTGKIDVDKRTFVKLIGSAGISLLFLSFFRKDAQAAFFGSVPGPGTVSLKDTSGNQIDPAEKHPTDGYRVNEFDDATIPSYFGFVNKTGNWYIIKESPAGTFRYNNGGTDVDFSTNWTDRAALAFSLFGDAF